MAIAAYVHLPFCRRRCFYCDFAVFPLGDRLSGENSGTVENYLDYLEQEIAIAPQCGSALTTVFIGGGTPSLLSPAQIERVLQAISDRLGITKDAEISIEIDPGTFDEAKLRSYAALGINRFSMGVQAFQDDLLKLCGRSHTVTDIWKAIDAIDLASIDNWSLDLISGLPTQTIEQWQYSLKKAVEIAPNHISTYDLIVEPTTVFARKYQSGEEPLPDDVTTAAMYQLATDILTGAGYEHYEISNYARSGYKCQHNLTYWENKDYYGFGMGAASYINRQRYTRPRKTQEYFKWVENLIERKGAIDFPLVSTVDSLLDRVMLGLRLARGIDLTDIASEFGSEAVRVLQKSVEPYIQKGWVSIEDSRGRDYTSSQRSVWLRLTDPQGFLFSNTILAHIFSELDLN